MVVWTASEEGQIKKKLDQKKKIGPEKKKSSRFLSPPVQLARWGLQFHGIS